MSSSFFVTPCLFVVLVSPQRARAGFCNPPSCSYAIGGRGDLAPTAQTLNRGVLRSPGQPRAGFGVSPNLPGWVGGKATLHLVSPPTASQLARAPVGAPPPSPRPRPTPGSSGNRRVPPMGPHRRRGPGWDGRRSGRGGAPSGTGAPPASRRRRRGAADRSWPPPAGRTPAAT